MLSELFESVERENAARKAALAARGFKVGDLVGFYRGNKWRQSVIFAAGPKRAEVRYTTETDRRWAKKRGLTPPPPHVVRVPFGELRLIQTVESRLGAALDHFALRLRLALEGKSSPRG